MELGNWIINNLLGIAAFIISIFAYLQSKSANKIAADANQLAEINIKYSKDKDKQTEINKIIDRIIENWSKNGGARATIMSEWKIYKLQGYTEDDFNFIWTTAYERVKKRSPDESFRAMLEQR